MRNTRLSGIWAQMPWRRRKDEQEEPPTPRRKFSAPPPPPRRGDWRPSSRQSEDRLAPLPELKRTDDSQPKVRRIWKAEDISEASATRKLSASYRRFSRTFATPVQPDDPPELGSNGAAASMDTSLTEESFLRRMRRKSQTFSLPRPRTSSGVSRRLSFFSSTIHETEEEAVPALPVIPEHQQQSARPRHIPITIDYLQFPLEGEQIDRSTNSYDEPGLGMAITSNDIQPPTTSPQSEQPRSRTLSVSNSFSQLRIQSAKTARNIFRSSRIINEQSTYHSDNDDDHDVITDLPPLDFKDLNRATGSMHNASQQFSDGPYASVDRQIFQRATPNVVDIVSPRPMSMITSGTTPTSRSRPTTANATTTTATATTARTAATKSSSKTTTNRHRSMVSPPTALLINDEDGPKGDWSRTRHSWLGADTGDSTSGSEQMEWEKLKQFIEAYSLGIGGDLGVVSIRQVEEGSDSSGTDSSRSQPKYSNAQALAALEFGLN